MDMDRVGKQYREIFCPHFAFSQELLLHDALQHEIDSSPSPSRKGNSLLSVERDYLMSTCVDYDSIRKLIGFLLRFEEFNSVVVRCARKMDPIVWEPLFVIAGNCKKMFVQCLSSGQLHTAASYLQIIRYTKGLVIFFPFLYVLIICYTLNR